MSSVGDALGKHRCIRLVDQGARLRSAPVIACPWVVGLVVYHGVMLGRKLSAVIFLWKSLEPED